MVYQGSPQKSLCPYCACVIKSFTRCFIATAVYGDCNHPKVITLRKFRDEHLLTNDYGIKFVEFYYKNSPKFADYIKDKKVLSYPIRKILDMFSYLLEKLSSK